MYISRTKIWCFYLFIHLALLYFIYYLNFVFFPSPIEVVLIKLIISLYLIRFAVYNITHVIEIINLFTKEFKTDLKMSAGHLFQIAPDLWIDKMLHH